MLPYGGGFTMKDSQQQSLYNQFKYKSDEELNAIIHDDSYDDVAKEIAKEILNGDRTAYHNIEQKQKQIEEREEAKIAAQLANPLYDDIHQIADDVHFIKNVVKIGLIVAIVAFIAIIVISGLAIK